MDSSFLEHLEDRGWAGEVAWLRDLAASLVRDPDEADDLALEVWVQALERRPVVSADRPLRAWLSVVLRRLASRKRRETSARRDREQRAARREGIPAADESIQRVELQRKLVEAVLALAEPYRSAVVLRHLEQLSIPQIAQRQGCSNESARQRVARGLQQLRVSLDRRFDGGRDAWRAIFLPFAAHAPFSGGAALTGALLVSSKAIGGALACVAAVLLVWWWPSTSSEQSANAALFAEDAFTLLDPSSDESSRIAIPNAAASRDHAARAPARLRLAGKVVDSSGAPLAGVDVSFSSEIEFGAENIKTNDAGFFERELSAEPPADAVIEAWAGSAEHCGSRTPIQAGEDVLIVLQRLPRVEVSVIGPDGLPPESSGIVKLEFKGKFGGVRTTSLMLDEDGIARSDPLQPGRLVRLQANFGGFAAPPSARSDELVPNETLRIQVVLTRGITLRGRTLDARTLRPVSGAMVQALSSDPLDLPTSPTAVSDESGRFELQAVQPTTIWSDEPGVLPTEHYWVTVNCNGYFLSRPRGLVWKHSTATPTPAVIDNLELLLIPTGSLNVKLRWADGRAATDQFNVRIAHEEHGLVSSEMSAGGEFNFFGVPSGEIHVTAIPVRFDKTRGIAWEQISLSPGRRAELALTLQLPDAVIEGRVTDTNGHGVPDVLVIADSLLKQFGGRSFLEGQDARTDAQGRFRIESLYPGSCRVQFAIIDPRPLTFWPPRRELELEAGSLVAGVDARAEPRVNYSGVVAPTSGIDAANPLWLHLTHADFDTLASARVSQDGTFDFIAMPGIDYVMVLKQGKKELARVGLPRGGARNLVVPIER